MPFSFEQLGPKVRLCVSPQHKFGTDAFLLSAFAKPRRKDRVCDLCAGCGIVGALWFRREEDTPKWVQAVELQDQAVAQMEETLRAGGLPRDRFFPIQGDLRQPQGLLEPMSVDLVTCNPPYREQGGGILSAQQSDQIARHETMCGIQDVCRTAAYLLNFGGRLCICQRPQRLADAICAMREAGLEPKRLRMVQQRPDTAPWLFLLEGRKGGKPFLTVEPPLIIEGPGGFSREVLDIYQKEENL